MMTSRQTNFWHPSIFIFKLKKIFVITQIKLQDCWIVSPWFWFNVGWTPASVSQKTNCQVKNQIMKMKSGQLQICTRLSSGPVLSCLACYGGGVILATCFTHMMPEVQATYPKDCSGCVYSRLTLTLGSPVLEV